MTKSETSAAKLLGRKGGRIGGKSRSEAKVQAARANGKKGGFHTHKLQRDPAGRTCSYCIEELGEVIPLDSNGTCHGCGACFGEAE